MLDSDSIISAIIPTVMMALILTLLIKAIPSYLPREFAYCSTCQSRKFWFKPPEETKFILCKKCNEQMGWIEIPENLYRTHIFYLRLSFSFAYPLAVVSLFFLLPPEFVYTMFFPWFIVGWLLSFIAAIFIAWIITDRISKRSILNWARKEDFIK